MKRKQKKKRSASPLTLRERSIIEVRWCKDAWSVTEIAGELERHKSSISRELRGKTRRGRGRYNADVVHRKACTRIEKRGNTPKTERVPALKKYVEDKMALGWSPEQIHLRLPLDHRHDEAMRVATETVYQEVYRRVHRGGNGKVKAGETDLRSLLPRRHKRRQKKGFRQAQKMYQEPLPSIEDRPAVVDRRKQIGHWEDDTMVSRQSTDRLKSINERVSGVVLLGKMKDGTIAESNRVVCERLKEVPLRLRKTLTRDRGTENLGWKDIEKELTLTCYFAHAYCSQERGSNENLNGLVRRVYPKKTDFRTVTDADLRQLEYRLNTRPRKRHGGKTPLEVFFKATGVALYSGI